MTDAPVGVLHHVELRGAGPRPGRRRMGPAARPDPDVRRAPPWAGGSEHYAGYLENSDGFEVELVARSAGNP